MRGTALAAKSKHELRGTYGNIARRILLVTALAGAWSYGSNAQEAERKVRVKVAPEYPEVAKRMNMAGIARVEIVIATSGDVTHVKELGGNPVLLEALTKAVSQWKYEPASKQSTQEVKFEFKR